MIDKHVSTAIEKMPANVAGVRFENIDEPTAQLAKNRIIDVIGCAIGGA